MTSNSEEALVHFINETLLVEKPGVRVDALTPLFREGWIDSLKILQLIAFVEVQRGVNIPDRDIVMDRFENVRAICRHFLPSVPEIAL